MFRMVSTLKLFAKDLTKFADVSVNLLICPTLSKWFSVGNAQQSMEASLVIFRLGTSLKLMARFK